MANAKINAALAAIRKEATAEWQSLISDKRAASATASKIRELGNSAGKHCLQLLYLSRGDFDMIDVKDAERAPTVQSTATAEEILAIGIKMAAGDEFAQSTCNDVRAFIRRFARLDEAKRTTVLSQSADKGMNEIRKQLAAAEGKTPTVRGPNQRGEAIVNDVSTWKEPEAAEVLASVTKMGEAADWLALISMVQDIGLETSIYALNIEIKIIERQQQKR
jgi:hypothetical protein